MEALKQNYNRLISPSKAKKLIILLVFTFFFDFLLFPAPVIAIEGAAAAANNKEVTKTNNISTGTKQNDLFSGTEIFIESVSSLTITAYNSEPGQTDNSPCVTANGFNLCEHGIEDTVAANFLPFGAKVRIPDLYGSRIFTVRDRMNARYQNRMDIWMASKDDAIQFGVKKARIEVLGIQRSKY